MAARIMAARTDRMRFAMQLSLEATDTLLGGADPVAGTLQKMPPGFLHKRALYCDVAQGTAPPGLAASLQGD